MVFLAITGIGSATLFTIRKKAIIACGDAWSMVPGHDHPPFTVIALTHDQKRLIWRNGRPVD